MRRLAESRSCRVRGSFGGWKLSLSSSATSRPRFFLFCPASAAAAAAAAAAPAAAPLRPAPAAFSIACSAVKVHFCSLPLSPSLALRRLRWRRRSGCIAATMLRLGMALLAVLVIVAVLAPAVRGGRGAPLALPELLSVSPEESPTQPGLHIRSYGRTPTTYRPVLFRGVDLVCCQFVMREGGEGRGMPPPPPPSPPLLPLNAPASSSFPLPSSFPRRQHAYPCLAAKSTPPVRHSTCLPPTCRPP